VAGAEGGLAEVVGALAAGAAPEAQPAPKSAEPATSAPPVQAPLRTTARRVRRRAPARFGSIPAIAVLSFLANGRGDVRAVARSS
jgi:hypothetical protein